MFWLEPFAWVLAAVVLVPLLVLTVECFAARLPKATPPGVPLRRQTVAVLIPAHDEESVISRTLAAILPQLAPGDRVVVVADNCTDGTAAVARSHGAEVVERFDANHRGKGYALAHGLDRLRSDPIEVVVVLDADCVIGDGALGKLIQVAADTGRPAQAAYFMDPPAAAGPERRVAAFAFLVKNVVRPLGLRRLGRPCLLTGSGMAFPWDVIAAANLGHGHIVEDMQLAVELALSGRPPVFVPDAEVWGEFPVAGAAAGSQRRRWEHGHLQVMCGGVPRLLKAGVRKGCADLFALGLELAVPPLSALMMIWVTVTAGLCAFTLLGGSPWPLVALSVAWTLAVGGLGLAWVRFARHMLTTREMFLIPLYAFKKIPLYLGYITRPQTTWVRTQRESAFPSN